MEMWWQRDARSVLSVYLVVSTGVGVGNSLLHFLWCWDKTPNSWNLKEEKFTWRMVTAIVLVSMVRGDLLTLISLWRGARQKTCQAEEPTAWALRLGMSRGEGKSLHIFFFLVLEDTPCSIKGLMYKRYACMHNYKRKFSFCVCILPTLSSTP